MDSGIAIVFVPLMFVSGLAITFFFRLLVQSWRWWMAALLGALLPPSLLLVAGVIANSAALAPNTETVAALAIIWAAALIPALVGAVCGAFVGTRAKRKQEF